MCRCRAAEIDYAASEDRDDLSGGSRRLDFPIEAQKALIADLRSPVSFQALHGGDGDLQHQPAALGLHVDSRVRLSRGSP